MKIIYRAFDKKKGEMYFHIDEIDFLLGGDVIRANSVISELEEHRMFNSYDNLDDGFILQRYIGLKDKKGQWLFEGDICVASLPCNDENYTINVKKQVLAKIVYIEEHAAYMFEYDLFGPVVHKDIIDYRDYTSSTIHINSKMMAECEVVGNIYQSNMEVLNKTFAREFKINKILL
jgi:uncharacterized phage protein (TIGR01671 family)